MKEPSHLGRRAAAVSTDLPWCQTLTIDDLEDILSKWISRTFGLQIIGRASIRTERNCHSEGAFADATTELIAVKRRDGSASFHRGLVQVLDHQSESNRQIRFSNFIGRVRGGCPILSA